jgi:protein O-GlcNAc transferase
MTVDQAINLGLQHHRAGQFAEAEAIYRQILSQQPNQPDALHLLGLIAQQAGRRDLALDLIKQALRAAPQRADMHGSLGLVLQEMNQPDESIAAYQQAIALDPNLAQAHSNLGNVLLAVGRPDEAEQCFRRAMVVQPGLADPHYNLARLHSAAGRLNEAISGYRQALSLRPDWPQALNNLGALLKEQGQFQSALECFQKALALSPNYAVVLNNLGDLLCEVGQARDALPVCTKAVQLRPDLPEAHNNLGNALCAAGQFEPAVAEYRRALELRPGYAEAHDNLGNALRDNGQLDEAIAAYRQAIVLNPNLASAHNNLGTALIDKGQFDEAIAAYRQAIVVRPDYAIAFTNLGSALKDEGQLDDAIAAHRQAIALRPGYAEAHSNLIFAMLYHPGYEAQSVAQELGRWNRQHADPLRKFIQAHPNDRRPDRRLRVGYVSTDFCLCICAYLLAPLLKHHDPRQVEVFCYAQVARPDAMTIEFQRHADEWRNISGVSDDQVARQIRQDQIDILVDLKLHTAKNRLLVFARKPAPVQVIWLGYPGSTGLSAIDYRLSDPYLDPLGMDETVYSERTIRLPDAFWCYDPLDSRDIPVSPLPALDSGVVTFGSLNNFCKFNDDVLALWAKVLRQVEASRLLLLAPMGDHRSRTLERFRQEGIEPGRIEFVPHQSHAQYLATYRRIDLGLDTIPYCGHTTSMDSFWMGVPVLTLVGNRAVGRAGWCLLSNLRLTELVGRTPDEFVRIATELASDLPRLQHLRSTLRTRMQQSPLMDAPKFARNIEAAYRQMWQTWCQNATPPKN